MTFKDEFNKVKDDLFGMSKQLYYNPDLGDQEYESMELFVNYLRSHDFLVETGVSDRPTAFRAEISGKTDGPTVVFLAEYDALPGIGHACGHNLISNMAVGAGVILSKYLDDIGGKVIVLGTPAD